MAGQWWVNHKGTVQHEVAGGYLWSPKREKKARSQFYDNMRIASPGDHVVSYAHGRVGHIGIVTAFATDALKPVEFGSAGDGWAPGGWVLPVEWRKVQSPFVPSEHWATVKGLLPEKYSPLVAATGRGSQKAYLSAISDDLFNYVLGNVGILSDLLKAEELRTSSYSQVVRDLESSIEDRIKSDIDLDDTTKERLVASRMGQGSFRSDVLGAFSECRVTGVTAADFLVASHIKPWRSCESGFERLDANNGLMLAHHVDRLFDRGYISFEDGGNVIVSSKVPDGLLKKLGLGTLGTSNVGVFSDKQSGYLAYHRANVFLGR